VAGNTVNLEFAGDARRLQQAGQQAETAVAGVGASANEANADLDQAAKGSSNLGEKMGNLGAAVDGASTAIGDAAGTLQALADVQDESRAKAMRLARAEADVEQAMIDTRQAAVDLKQGIVDLNQAHLDGKQATVDHENALIAQQQALIDIRENQKAYNEAVAEHGADSAEAKQAMVDLKTAQQELKQGQLDAEQATADGTQATTDAEQAQITQTQAVRDGKDAQLDLNDAMHEAHPPELQQWADKLNLIAPLMSGLVGIFGLVTAAQWLLNLAMTANPIGLIIVAVGVLIAIIVVIATKTTWFQDLWRVTWGWIKDAAAAVGDWFANTLWPGMQAVWGGIVSGVMWVRNKFREGFQAARDIAEGVIAHIAGIPGRIVSAFSSLSNAITAPFRAAFSAVARAWNNTVGSLSWTVPDWVPGMGGSHISAPRLPTMHQGGIVPGSLGAESLAVLQAGERVTAGRSSGGATVIEIRSGGTRLDDLLVEVLARAVNARGGNVQLVLGSA
jgi:phage-related protein